MVYERGLNRGSLVEAAGAVRAPMVQPQRIVPIHLKGWSHFILGLSDIEATYREAGIAGRAVVLPRGGTLPWGPTTHP